MGRIDNKLRAKARKIKFIATDIDGVLTGGEIIILKNGEELKFWHARDRIAIRLIQGLGGFRLGWITGRDSWEVKTRAKELSIDAVYTRAVNKKHALDDIRKRFKVRYEEIAFIGDDLVDLPVLKRVGLSFCPCDAPIEIKKQVDHVTSLPGGKGVFREVVEIILKSQGKWDAAVKKYDI